MGKRYKVELTPLAEEQILQIAQYIIDEYQAPTVANRVVDRLESAFSQLATMPERIVLVDMEPWHSSGVHKYIVGSYITYFMIDEPMASVRIMAVVLIRRDQKKQLEKMKL